MRNKRAYSKKKNRVFGIVLEHVKQNVKEYTIAVLIFFIGIFIGTMLVNSSSPENKSDIMGYIGNFIVSIKNGDYIIDGKKLLIKSIISNIRLAVLFWVSGLLVIGIPVIYVVMAYKGVCIGYSISAIIAALGRKSGIIFSLSTMLLPNIIAVPCFMALMVSALKMFKSVTTNRSKENLKTEIIRHTIFSLFMTIGLLFASFVEYFFTTSFFSDIIIKFV